MPPEYDRDARFPAENYDDMRNAGLLGICVPRVHSGPGAGFRAYSTTDNDMRESMNSSRRAILLQRATLKRLNVPAGILLIGLGIALCARTV